MSRPHWSELKRSLALEPGWKQLYRAVLPIIDAHSGGRSSPKLSRQFYSDVRRAIEESTGAWYGAATQAGDEMLRSWCWCHSPWKGWAGHENPSTHAASSVVDEVRACFDWHVKIVEAIDASAPPKGDIDRLAELVVSAVDIIVELGINDCWYPTIAPVTAWMLERHGLQVDTGLTEAIEDLTARSFTSWSEPAPATRRDFADEVALVVLDRRLAVRWPEPS